MKKLNGNIKLIKHVVNLFLQLANQSQTTLDKFLGKKFALKSLDCLKHDHDKSIEFNDQFLSNISDFPCHTEILNKNGKHLKIKIGDDFDVKFVRSD